MENNFATMHSALTSAYMVLVKAHMDNCPIPPAELVRVISILEQAVAIKPRNCDVGTPEEQWARFNAFCDQRVCAECELPMNGCRFAWSQLPYEKGGEI